jgi:hypothetical protein
VSRPRLFLSHICISTQFGFDFTVHGNSINVTSLLIYASNNALVTSKRVTIFDRATGKLLLGAAFAAGTPRQPIIPFAQEFVDLQLRPGVYSILVVWNGSDDLCARGFAGTDEKVVRTTASIVTGSASTATMALVTNVTVPEEHVGATFRFVVVPNAPPPPLAVATEFADCEAVACARLPTGEYSVGGKRTFCDNDEAGGGWTRIWRLNDSSCEEIGWSSGRNARANGTDPAGCRSGKEGCSPANVTWPNESFAELMGKNWAIWSFGTPDAFGSGDGVVVSAESQRLWTFSLTHSGSWNRCPCDPLFFTTDPAIIARINATDYICDAGADAGLFAPVFLAGGANLCSREGADRRSFQKALPEQQRRSAQVMICLNQENTDEDIKIGALDLFARKTPRFNKAIHCPTTFLPSTTQAPKANATATTTATASGVSSTSSAAQQLRQAKPSGPNVAVIAGAVGGSVGALLIAATIFLVLKRRQKPSTSKSEGTSSSTSSQNVYGQLSVISAPVQSEYDVGNVTLPPESTD